MRFVRAAIDTPRPAIAITSHIYILLSSEVFAAPAAAALVPALVFTFTKANVPAPGVRAFAGCVVGAVVGTVVLPLLASS